MEYNINWHHQEYTENFSIERDINIKSTLQFRYMCSGRLVPAKPVVQAHTTNRDSSEPTMAGKSDTKIISICVPQRTTQFQSHDNGTIGVCLPNPQKFRPQGIVGNPLYQCVVPGNFHQALSLLKCTEQRTDTKRVSDTVYFKHKYITNPTVTPEDVAVQAAQ